MGNHEEGRANAVPAREFIDAAQAAEQDWAKAKEFYDQATPDVRQQLAQQALKGLASPGR